MADRGRGMAVHDGGQTQPLVGEGREKGRHYILLLTADGLDEWLGKEQRRGGGGTVGGH